MKNIGKTKKAWEIHGFEKSQLLIRSTQLEEASTRYVLIQSSLLSTFFTYKEQYEQSSIIISRHQLSSQALVPYFWFILEVKS